MVKPIKVQMRTKRQAKKNKLRKNADTTAVGKVIRGLGSLGGGALGGYFGNPLLGSAAGNQLGALASKWLGFGDYAVSTNSVLSKASSSIPMMHGDDQSIVVRHKEYVGVVKSAGNFTVQYELPLNPGMDATFPWLSDVASRFQEYAFKGMVFHYIPTSGTAISGTNSALGSVMIQTTYRASDTAPIDKVEMLNEYCASQGVPSESFIHPIECDPKENPFNVHYVRNTAPPSTEPLMSYDLGRTFVATQGQQVSNIVLGDLWVTYEVELKKPLIRSAVVNSDITRYDFQGSAFTNLGHMFDGTKVTTDVDRYLFGGSTVTIPARTGKKLLINVFLTDTWFSAFSFNNTAVLQNCSYKNVSYNSTFDYTQIVSGQARASFKFLLEVSDPTLIASIDLTTTFSGTASTLGTHNLVTIAIVE